MIFFMYNRIGVMIMKSVTIELESEIDAWLESQASERNTTKAALVSNMLRYNKRLSDLVSMSDEEFDQIIYG